jgi:hypothetical protein
MNILLIFLLVSTLATPPIALPAPPTNVLRGNAITLSVQLKNPSGTPIENATILFFHETQNELLGTAISNSTGFARFIWMIPFTHELGPVQLNATFRGDPERYLLPSMVPIPLTIFAQLQNNIIVTDENYNPMASEVRIGQRLFFHTLISDDLSNPLENITVQFIIGPNQLLAEHNTPHNGSLVFSCTVNQTSETQFTLIIRSINQGYYNGTATSFPFHLLNSTVHFVGIPIFWHPSIGYSLQGKLISFSGEGIANASVELLLESEVQLKSTQTDNAGHFYLDLYDVTEFIQGNHYLILRYNGTSGQKGARSIIRIIASPPHNPFTQSIELIIAVSCLTIGTSILTLRMKRSSKRIVSH